jgi:S1-C subfamily serine protease
VLARLRALSVPLAIVVAITALGYGCALTRPDAPSREDVLERLLPSAVQIVLEHPEGRRFRTGSGVIIASRPAASGPSERPECFVLTSGHTVAGAAGQKAIYLLFGRQRGEGTKASAVVVAHRETADVDVALLRAESHDCVPAHPAGTPRLGAEIWVLTFPWGRNMVLAGGIVSQVHGDEAADPGSASHLMVDASVSYGSSGGGVYEARGGGLIGLVEGYRTARVTSQGSESPWYIDVPMPGQTLVTPLAEIRRFLADTGHADLIEGTPTFSGRAAR